MSNENNSVENQLIALGEHIKKSCKKSVESFEVAKSELVLHVKRDELLSFAGFLHDDTKCQFKLLMDICGVDYPARENRFEVVYNFLSLKLNHRVRVKLLTDEKTPVPSVVDIYPTAGWFEREAWDMYGIFFAGNPDLRRILTDYGFDGHPLRKDFPLTGYVEMRYDPEQQKVIYEPVQLQQAYRSFDAMSPWEGAEIASQATEKEEGAA